MDTKTLSDMHDMKIDFILYCSENKKTCMFNIVAIVFQSIFCPCLVESADVELVQQRAG